MALFNCKDCGKLYNKIVSDYCPICNDKIEGYFNDVNHYIYDKGPQPIHIVSQATGVNPKWIMKFIHDGRLINSSIEYPCQQCGDFISKGKLCNKCVKEWNDHLKEKETEKESLEPKFKGKMYSRRDEYDGY